MRCGLCSDRTTKYIKVKKGVICPACYEALPTLIKNNVGELSCRQILHSRRIMSPVRNKKVYWAQIGRYDEENGEEPYIMAADDRIAICGTEIRYSDLWDIYLDFHPFKKITEGVIKGYATLVVVTDKPRIIIEKRIPDFDREADMCLYKIHGRSISYLDPGYASDRVIVNGIMDIVTGHRYNMKNVKQKYTEAVYGQMKYRGLSEEEWEEKMRKIERERAKKDREKRERERKEQAKKEQAKKEQEKKTKNEKPLSDFDKAKFMFGVEIPYTEAELKKKRNELIKKNHPDDGGSTKKAMIINEYYDLLKKFAI